MSKKKKNQRLSNNLNKQILIDTENPTLFREKDRKIQNFFYSSFWHFVTKKWLDFGINFSTNHFFANLNIKLILNENYISLGFVFLEQINLNLHCKSISTD